MMVEDGRIAAHDAASWVGAYAAFSDGAKREQLAKLGISRSPSVDNLYVDVTCKADGSRSRLFLRSLLEHELYQPAPKHKDGVGFARLLNPKGMTSGGSMFSCVFTLVVSAMGAGCLSLPHMFKQSGFGQGIILLVVGAVLAHTTLVVLVSCARYTECKSFAELVAFGATSHTAIRPSSSPRVRSAAVDLAIALYGLAAVLIYLILIGDFVVDILDSPLFRCAVVSRRSVIICSMLVVFPLSLVRSITELRFISVLSTSAIALLTVVVLVKALGTAALAESPTHQVDQEEPLVWFAGDFRTTLKSFTIAMFAFNAHTNAVPVALAMDHPRAGRIWQVCGISVLIELVVYIVVAASGYYTFRVSTQQDFIRNYAADDLPILIVRCSYAVPIIFGIPVNLAPAAASIKALVSSLCTHWTSPPSGVVPLASSDHVRGAQRLSDNVQDFLRHAAVIAIVLVCCAALAINCAQVADVMGLLGGLFGTLLCIWWPQQIYNSVLSTLHPRNLRVPLHLMLRMAALLGILAFLSQAVAMMF